MDLHADDIRRNGDQLESSFQVASGGFPCACEIFLISFGNAHARFNLLSFLAPRIRDAVITIFADAERRNGD